MSTDARINGRTANRRRAPVSRIGRRVELRDFAVHRVVQSALDCLYPHPGRSNRSLWIALALSIVFYFVSLTIIPRRYYNLQPFEQDGRLYRRLGMRQFRYIVGEGEGIQKLARRIDPQWQSTLSKLSYDERIKWTQTAEWIHISMIFLSLPLIALAYRRGFTTFATLYLLSNIPFNIYPILLQRYTRAKLLRICNLQSNRSASQNGKNAQVG